MFRRRRSAFIAALYDLHASSKVVVVSADTLGSFSTRGSDSPTRIPNRFAIRTSVLKTSSFLATRACSWSRISPVRQSLARKLSRNSFPRLVIEPATTAALAVRSQTSAATSGVSLAFAGLHIRLSIWLTRGPASRDRPGECPNCTARISRSDESNAESPVVFAKSARTTVLLSVGRAA